MIYIYGNSFTCPPDAHKHDNLKNTWPSIVARCLKTQLCNYGLGGSCFAHTFRQIKNSHKKWTDKDTVIISQSSVRRKLFFNDLPNTTKLQDLLDSKRFGFSQDQKEFLYKFCYPYFHNDTLSIEELTAYYNLINDWLIEKNVYCYVLHCFNPEEEIFENFSNITFSFGKQLYYISDHEFKIPRHINDDRVGHFTEKNHKLIAKQVLKAIIDKSPVDLSGNFVKGVLN